MIIGTFLFLCLAVGALDSLASDGPEYESIGEIWARCRQSYPEKLRNNLAEVERDARDALRDSSAGRTCWTG
jgi:hypothetical protein